MKNIEKAISPLIESQFPTFYRDEGPNFIAFVKAYYEWLESEGNTLYHARRLGDYRDIDTTLDDFILYFKEKYLKNIQFDIASNKKLLIKNSLDLYRSKGSERSIDLFFKLVYGTEADVKYPKENLFKLSSGDWEKPQYLEVTESSRNIDYVGKLISGTISNATAFVEKFIRRKTATGYVSVLQISDIQGSFQNNEKIGVVVNGNQISYDDSPFLIGSLSRVIIQDGSIGFKVGDLVNVQSSYQGVGGLARVTAVANATGAVDFLFLDGGWGYTNTSSLSIVSEKVLILNDVQANVQSGEYFSLFEKLVQPIVSVTVDNALSDIPVGTFVYRTDASNTVVGTAQVITSNIAEDSTGELLLSVQSGSIIAAGNTYYANIFNGNTQTTFEVLQATDRTIVSRVMGIPTRYEMSIIDQFGTLEVGDTLFQADKVQTYGSGRVVSVSPTLTGSIVVLDDASGAFRDSHAIYPVNSDSVQFNGNSAVNASSYAISFDTHNFKENDFIVYRTATGNTAISGLANNGTYFIVNTNPSSVQLSRIKGGAPIPLIPSSSVGSTGHFIIGNNLNLEYARIAANSTSIDEANKFIKIPGNDFELGETVFYTTDAGNTAIGGLANGTHYFVTASNSSGIKIATAYNGEPINLIPGANETGHNLLARAHISALTPAGVKKPDFTADFGSVGFNLGVYDIKKEIFNLGFTSASSNAVYDSPYIYHYNEDNIEIAKGRVVTVELSGSDGFMTVIPLSGYFIEGRTLYTEGNTASAVVTESTSTIKGGDFVLSDYSSAVSLLNDTTITISRSSFGSGAQFEIGAISENESIFINTDLLSANANIYVNNERADLTIVSTAGFTVGDTVYQLESTSFNSNSGVSNTGFITTAGANPFVNGDIVQYSTNTTPLTYQVTPWPGANTITQSFANGDQFFVVYANTSGFKITQQREGTGYLDILSAPPGSNGHSFSKVTAAGTLIDANTTHLKVTDVYKQFNTTSGNYGPVTSYSNTALSANVTSIGTMPTLLVPEKQYPVERIRSAAFGFPKNPQADINSTIYSCLTFDKFDIGTISGIYGVDPGSQYNIDPFVVVYQPYIAAFDRKDYIFKITNLSSPLVVGEKISQTPTSLTYYDLQVSGGVKDAAYNEVIRSLDASIDIDGSADFIYVPYTEFVFDANTEVDSLSVHFNSTFDVDPVSKELLFDVLPFVNGDAVLYTTPGTAIGGLANNTTYYVLNTSNTGFQLAANSLSTTPISVTRTPINEVHVLSKAVNNFITVPSNNLPNNTLVRYYTEVGTTATPGLANGNLYLIANATSFGFFLANTANTSEIISVNASGTPGIGHRLRSYYNGESNSSLYFANNDLMLYNIYDGGSNVGLSNATSYFVVYANTVGFKLANAQNGAVINLTPSATSEVDHYISTVPGFLPGDIVYQEITSAFNAQANVNALTDFITIDDHPYNDGDTVVYYTGTGGTSITGANNTSYTVTQANSTGFKLASGATVVELTPAGTSQFHNIKSTPTGVVSSVFQSNNASFVRVTNAVSTFTTSYELLSQSFEMITGTTVLDVQQYSQLITAQGIVKAIVDSETILVKRIEFENTFEPAGVLTGQLTGATATLVSVAADESSTPIGVNALIEANVVTANGVITNLQVIDSGIGYANSEIVQYSSLDGLKSGTGKAVIDGHGTSKGYYRSSKGFLSADMKIHDGDYYQEYSYEVLSKISFDRYSDMFKKVMHVAGTKVFGSAAVIENADVNADVVDIETDQVIEFNPRSDIDTLTDRLDVGIPENIRTFNPLNIDSVNDTIYMRAHPFTEDEPVVYYTSPGNTAPVGLANNQTYYVTRVEPDTFNLSNIPGSGIPIPLTPGLFERGHHIVSYKNPLANNDLVEYYPEHRAFNKVSDIEVEEDFIYLQQHNFNDGDRVRYVSVDNDAVNGLVNNALYYVAQSNSTGVKLTNGEKSIAAVFKYDAATKDLVIHMIDSRSYSNVNLVANTFGSLSTKTFTTRGGEVRIHGSGYTLVANNYQAAIYQGNTNVLEDILFSYNEDGLPSGPVGNVSVVFVGSQYFNRFGYGNVTRYSYVDDVVDIYAEWPTRVDYHITDNSYEDMLPTEDQGFVVDLLQPVAKFGQANINFATDFLTIKNVNSQTNTPLFANGDIIRYDASFRNIPIKDLFVGNDYYVVQANATGFKVAETANGTPIDFYKVTANVNSVADVSDEYNFIIIRDNEFAIDDPIVYTQANNSRPITGLANNGTYYVVYANNVGIKVSTTQRGPTANVGPANTFTYAFDGFANVANTTNFISSANHSFQDFDAVVYTTANRIQAIGGLVNNTTYYVTYANTSGFKLSSSANGSTIVSITSTKTRLSEFAAATAVDSSNDFIAIASHSYITGDAVKYYTSASANTIGGLANNSSYYVVDANTAGIKLSSTPTGAAINITAPVGTGNSFIEAVQSNGHIIASGSTANTARFERQLSASGYTFTLINNDNGSGHILLGKDPLTGFELNQRFFVANTTPKTIQLTNTLGGNTIALPMGLNETGHYLKKIIED